MTIPPNVDPFHLVELTNDIDRRCFNVMVRDLPSVISVGAIRETRRKLRNEVRDLVSTMTTDWQELQRQTGRADILPPNHRLLDMEGLVELLPRVYSPPTLGAGTEGGAKALEDWYVDRVRWIIDSWFKVYGHLITRLSDETEPLGDVRLDEPGDKEAMPVPRPLELYTDMDLWRLVHRLTIEYVHARADLMRIADPSILPGAMQVSDEDWLEVASEAFWRIKPSAPSLLIDALRQALLLTLRLPDPRLRVDLRALPTSSLVILAAEAGLAFPVEVQVLVDVVLHLEGCQAYCKTPPASMLYPAYRIVDHVVKSLRTIAPRNTVVDKAVYLLNSKVEAIAAAND